MLQNELVASLKRLELIRKIRIRRSLNSLGLHPGQPQMIQYIIDHPECTQKEVADELSVTPASVAASLKRLQKSGIIIRKSDPLDSRRNRLSITEKGRMLNCEAVNAFSKMDQIMFDGISEDDRIAFKRMCDRIFDNLADEKTRDLNVCRLHSAYMKMESQKEEE